MAFAQQKLFGSDGLAADLASLEQGTGDWLSARLGCVTASRIADVVQRTRSGYGAARHTYMGQLISERLTGIPTEMFQTPAMRWGNDMEASAVDAYQAATGADVIRVGFLLHPKIAFSGASPDRLISHDGLLEVKCPTSPTHVDMLLTGQIPERYVLQMQWQMACAERQWCDFVSYDPRMPELHEIFIKRLARDDDKIATLEAEVTQFLWEVDDKISALMLGAPPG
jgi:putative phage-type endonuclease